MSNRKIFLDFDGVIFDTEKRVLERKNQRPDISWNEFFEKLNWFELLDESEVINNAIEYILEGQSKAKQIAILTKVHTLFEMEAKVKALRSRKVEIPIFFVPPHVKKSQIYLPNNGEILIDDSIKNLVDWEQNGGRGLYFNEALDSSTQFETIKSLNKIL
ncbi:MAG TPA: hypothetical protein IAC24_00885 [Candidatus Onthousia faecigallinarum]|nr:hypothetical protein [Candidatus Onthousia faecigallinarum]